MHWVKLPKTDTYINLALLIRVAKDVDYKGNVILILELGTAREGEQWSLWVTEPEDQAALLANLPGGTP